MLLNSLVGIAVRSILWFKLEHKQGLANWCPATYAGGHLYGLLGSNFYLHGIGGYQNVNGDSLLRLFLVANQLIGGLVRTGYLPAP